uniref:Beta-defensin-like domain-containing protein n=1 Tax=Catharus ustulatus TaxID=91951 RepID=A0A8C3U552_CATUS
MLGIQHTRDVCTHVISIICFLEQAPLSLNTLGFVLSLARPRGPSMECGYRGTFCHRGKCPRGNDFLGTCRPGFNCCKW